MRIQARFNGKDMEIELLPNEPGEEDFLGLFSCINSCKVEMQKSGPFDYMREKPSKLILTLTHKPLGEGDGRGEKG